MRAALARVVIAFGRVITAAGWGMMPRHDKAKRVLEQRGYHGG